MMMKKLLALCFGFAGLGCALALLEPVTQEKADRLVAINTEYSSRSTYKAWLKKGARFLLPQNIESSIDSQKAGRILSNVCDGMKELGVRECQFVFLHREDKAVIHLILNEADPKYIPLTRRGNRAPQQARDIEPALDVVEEMPVVAKEGASSSAAEESKEEKIARLAAEKKELDELTAGINGVGQGSKEKHGPEKGSKAAPKSKSKKR